MMRFSAWHKFLMVIIAVINLSACQDTDKITLPYHAVTPIAEHRGEEQTYLTLPEWYIVYISDEYATFIKNKPPSGFSYFGSIAQFWRNYDKVYQLTKNRYPFNTSYHVMIVVIGISTTLEYGFKGIYENTIGRFTELTRTHGPTDEDLFAYNTADDYVKFIRVYPWYEYRFDRKLWQLWKNTSLVGKDQIRKTERKAILSAEYSFKTIYALVIKKLTKISYEAPSPVTVVLVDHVPEKLFKENADIKLINKIDDKSQLVSLPRYDAFKDAAMKLVENGVKFKEIAGNTQEILVTVITNKEWKYNLNAGEVLFEQSIPSNKRLKRIAIKTPVKSLSDVLVGLKKQNIELEHIYDY